MNPGKRIIKRNQESLKEESLMEADFENESTVEKWEKTSDVKMNDNDFGTNIHEED